jgi:hypothetical protein
MNGAIEMRKPAVGKAIKIGSLVVLFLLLSTVWFLGVNNNSLARHSLLPVDSMFQEMTSIRNKTPSTKPLDLTDIAEKYIKLESSKEDVLAFFERSKNRLKIDVQHRPFENEKIDVRLEKNQWVCLDTYGIYMILQAGKVKDMRARYSAACL